MASKSSKKTTVTTTSSVSSSVTPGASTSRMPVRPQSPLSPTRISRLQEKAELQNLNDRLATYIERVRQLEHENSHLLTQVQRSEETVTREVTSIKSMYENELSDARRLLDDTARERAKLQIDCNKYRNEAEELAGKLAKKEKDCAAAEKNVVYYENKVQELQGRTNQAVNDKKRLEDEVKELRGENDKLNKQLASLRKQLEEETLGRVDLENRLQSLKEELQFKQSVYEKQITETQTRKQVEITKIDDKLQQQYKQLMADSLRELRESYETQMRMNREELEQMYESKMSDVRRLSDVNLGSAASAKEDLRQFKSKVDILSSRVSELEKENGDLMSRVKMLQQQIEDQRNAHLSILASKEEEIRQLQDLLAQQFREYQDLMDIKIALDMEIAAYRKLLESEEARLNITAVQSSREHQLLRATPVRRTPVGTRGVKRKRTMMTSEEMASRNFVSTASAKGDIEINDQDVEGKYVKLHNKGEKDISIGAWQVIRRAGDQEITYKFHRSIHCKAGQYVTIWSSKVENVTHSPPNDLVWKGQNWVTGDAISTVLVNNDGEEMATRETKREILSTQMLREGGYFEELDDDEQQHPERCVVM